MALKYQPKEKAVVMCDFSGFIAPEMVKTRPVVVISKHKKK
ncbi:type II toxin-antitoxin system PemK/MazF family toxin [Glaesserella parasuis]|nr:type II toxin-antitoxin system PemK/MazF family toxin [Glaesserella parasuis]